MSAASEPSGACPSDDQLVALVEGALGDATLGSIESHVDRCERCAAVIASLGALAPQRRTVGRYQLDRRIAAGGMGEVWAAWDPELRRDVAVKLVRPERADEQERVRLLREARALARLQHPNVLAVYDVGEVDPENKQSKGGGEVFIVSELVAGDTLAARGGPTADWRELVALYVQAARGLAAAHAAGLVHRDVKPANLLVGRDGRVRVADFGLAIGNAAIATHAPTLAVGATTDHITATGLVAGTPAYMAPEQRAGKPADASADQYALCVALVEAIDGRRPTPPLDAAALVAFVGERRTLEPALERLCAAITRGLATAPTARFPGATALADALEAASAAPTSATRPRRIAPVIAIAGLVVAGVAVAGGFAIQHGTSRDESAVPDPTPPPAVPAPPPAVAVAVAVADAGMPTLRPLAVADAGMPTLRPLAVADAADAASFPHTTHPSTPPAVPPTPAPAPDRLAAVQDAVHRHDARACAAALDGASSTPTIAMARARCQMLAGDCDGGVSAYLAASVLMPPARQVIADGMCEPGNDPPTRLRRLVRQVTSSITFDCDFYVNVARAAARDATGAAERVQVGSAMAAIAKCFASSGRCDTARAVWKDVAALDPRLQDSTYELGHKCDP